MKRLLLAIIALCIAAPAFAANPSFSIDNATADESAGKICFNVRKHGTINTKPSSVIFYAIDGTARFKPIAELLQFGAPASSQSACVELTNDATPGPTTTLTGKLIAVDNARLYDGTATGTVTDSDTSTPTPTPVTCPDGSTVPAGQTCPTTPPPPETVTCSDGTVLPAGSVCPVPSPWKPAAVVIGGKFQASQACPSMMNPADALKPGSVYDVQGFGTFAPVGGVEDKVNGLSSHDVVILTIDDGAHRGDGWFAFWVPVTCGNGVTAG